MKIDIQNNNKFPYLLIDNWFTEPELKNIWKEIDFFTIQNKFIKSSETKEVAISNKKPLANNFRVSPFNHYSDLGYKTSPIANSLNKIQNKDFHSLVDKTFVNTNTALANVFLGTNQSTSIISYYEKDNDYKEHFDQQQFTMITWLYKEPKNFTGGDFYFTKNNTKIKCVSNRTILFPGYYYHSVEPVKIIDTTKENSGRFSISTFFYTIPETYGN